MKKLFYRKLTFLALILMVSQIFYPFVNAFAATSMLPPSNLAAELVTPDDVKLTWNPVFGATGYNVYEITDGQLLLRDKTTSTSFNLNNLVEGSYRYVVSTLSAEGESGPSAPVSVDIVYPDMAAPATLTHTLTNGNDIALNWSAAEYAEKYHLYQISEDGEKTLISSQTSRTYTASNVPEGSYTYSVASANSLYGESQLSTPVQVAVVYPTMKVPSNFTFTVSNGNDVTFKWDSVSNATSYNLYQITNDEKVLKNTATATTLKLTNVSAGEYDYEIRSNSNRFGESADGSILKVTVGDVTMTAPSNFTYKLQNINDIVLTWGSVPYATNYKVYQIIDGEKVLKSTETGTSVTYAKAQSGDHVYEVHAYSDRFGESAEGSKVSLTVDAVTMEASSNFAHKIQNGNDIVLSWDATTNTTNYKVYQTINGQKVLKSTVTGTTVTFTNMPAGEYTYEVYSYSTRFGESQEGSKLSISLVHPTMKPPANLNETIKNDTDFTLNWDASENVTNYRVYQIVNDQKILKNSVGGTSITYTNMPSGDYTYAVYSYSSRFGESSEGTQLTFNLKGKTMQAPTNPTYTITNGNDVKLSWVAAENATNYKVYQVINGELLFKSTVTGTTVTYTNLPGGDYHYVIHSNSTLFGESENGAELKFSFNLPTIVAPGDLTYKIKNGNDIVLNWTAVEYANSYKVYEIVDSQKVLKYTGPSLSAMIAKVPAGEHSYVVHSVSTRFGESPEGSKLAMKMNEYTMDAPENLTDIITNVNTLTLGWDSVTFAARYKVYEIINDEKILKSTVTGTTVTISNLTQGEHQYEVHSESDRFGESPEGTQVSFDIVFPIIQAPENLTSNTQNGNDVVLNWEAAKYANSYKVYELVDGQKVLKATISTLSTTLTNVTEGEHTYVVHTVSSRFGESAEGRKLSFTLVFPTMEAPEELTHSFTNGNDLTLKWNKVNYATSYKVYQIINGERFLKSTISGTTVTYTNIPEGDYQYEIYSYSNRFGESPEESGVSFKMVYPTMQAPENITHTITNGNDFTLRWNAVTYATSYKVYQIIGEEKVLIRTVTGPSAAFTNMAEGDYKFEVHSYSSRFSESPENSKVSFTLVFPTMQAPENFRQIIANGNDFTLRWNSATYATSYKVYRSIDGQKELVKTLSGTATTFTNMAEGDYEYEVHSYSDRFGESPKGSLLNFTLTWPVVQPPQLKGTISNVNNITLTWPAVTWANEYRVYKMTDDKRELIYKGTALNYKVYNLTENTHSFEVTAYNTRFGASKASNRVTETIVYPEMESPITSLKLLSETSARITWDFITYANGYNIYEIINGEPVLLVENLNNLSYTVSNLTYANHEYYVTSYSNSFGESEPSNIVLAKLIVDTEAPVTTSNAITDWTNQSSIVSLTASDNETGVAATYYALDGSDFVEGTSFKVDGEGIHQVSYYSVDKVGNTEKAKTIQVKIDKTAPFTTSDAPKSWSKEDVTVKLTAADELSGVAKTYYSINGSEYVESASLIVEQEGINEISYYSIDNAGNKEDVKTAEIKIDKIAPSTSFEGPQTWVKDEVSVTLTAMDKHSGVEKTYYSINGSEYVEGTSLVVEQEGINEISYYSIDEAGNKEEVKTAEIKIDKTAPSTSFDAPQTWVKEEVTVTLTAVDKHSGVAKTYYSINGSEYVEGTTLVVEQEGINKISYYSIDKAGNLEKAQTIEVKIDKSAPVTTTDAPESWSKEDVTVKLTAEDELSGVAKTFYSINSSDYVEGSTFTLSVEGRYTVHYYSMDKVGNIESTKTVEVKVDKSAPVVSLDLTEEYKLGTNLDLHYSAEDNLSNVVMEKMLVTGPNDTVGKEVEKGTELTLNQPGVYNVTVVATNGAGLTTTIQKQFVVCIPATVEVTPKVIKGNKGVFTVRVDLPEGYSSDGLDLNTAELNGVNAQTINKGYYNQAKVGQFKFERSDFNWTTSEVTLTFRCYLNGYLVVGQTMVKVNQ